MACIYYFHVQRFISQAKKWDKQCNGKSISGCHPVVCTWLALVISVPVPSGCLFVWMALQFVEFNAVQLFKPLLTELTGVVVVGLWSVFLHVPVEGGTLAALIATDFTSNKRCGWEQKKEEDDDDDDYVVVIFWFSYFQVILNFYVFVWWTEFRSTDRSLVLTGWNASTCLMHRIESFSALTYWSGVSPVWVRLWTSRWFLRLNDFPHVSHMKSLTPVVKKKKIQGLWW